MLALLAEDNNYILREFVKKRGVNDARSHVRAFAPPNCNSIQ